MQKRGTESSNPLSHLLQSVWPLHLVKILMEDRSEYMRLEDFVEWSVNKHLFHLIVDHFGLPIMDLFALSQNHQLERRHHGHKVYFTPSHHY